MRALIIEDDYASRIVMKKYLEQLGPWEAQFAVDGMEAVDQFLEDAQKEIIYDLICIDVMLPRIDGMNVLKIIRELEQEHGLPQANVIMTTALHDKARVDEAFALGCQAYATKPLDLENIREVLTKLGFR